MFGRARRAFRQGEFRFVAQRRKSSYFVGKFVDDARGPGAFQADDEGSIPFTRSNVLNDLRSRFQNFLTGFSDKTAAHSDKWSGFVPLF
jgi:hypothetical protein